MNGNIKSGQVKVTTPGTPVPLSVAIVGEGDTTHIQHVTITALPSNAGVVMIGGSDVLATSGSEKGIALANMTKEQNFPIDLDMDDLSKIFIDAVNAGDGVSFAYQY